MISPDRYTQHTFARFEGITIYTGEIDNGKWTAYAMDCEVPGNHEYFNIIFNGLCDSSSYPNEYAALSASQWLSNEYMKQGGERQKLAVAYAAKMLHRQISKITNN